MIRNKQNYSCFQVLRVFILGSNYFKLICTSEELALYFTHQLGSNETLIVTESKLLSISVYKQDF
jgi:hypothetical protein